MYSIEKSGLPGRDAGNRKRDQIITLQPAEDEA